MTVASLKPYAKWAAGAVVLLVGLRVGFGPYVLRTVLILGLVWYLSTLAFHAVEKQWG